MQAIGPIRTSSPAQTGELVRHYFDWIDGQRSDPPAPPRELPAAIAAAISEPGAAAPGFGAISDPRRRRCLCISIEDARTPRQQPGSSTAAARAAAAHRTGAPSPLTAAPAAATRSRSASSSTSADHFRAENTPNQPTNQNRNIARGPEDRPLYAGWIVAALDAAAGIFEHPQTSPPPVKA